MFARDDALRIRQRKFRLGYFRLGEFGQSWVKALDPANDFGGSTRFEQVFRLFSVLLQARASRQLLCIHTNVLPWLCLESALIRLKECSFFRSDYWGWARPFPRTGCAHTNVLPWLCLESALIRLKE